MLDCYPGPPTIDANCVGRCPLLPLNPKAVIRKIPPLRCRAEPETASIIFPNAITYQVAFHQSCVCNELQALHNRHLVNREINFDKDYFSRAAKNITKDWYIECSKSTLMQALSEYRGRKRRLYFKARQDIKEFGVLPSDSNIKMFVKPDKYPAGVIEDKAPRAIQYRHARYNLVLATYLRPLEHEFYSMAGTDGLRVITKGMNNTEIARLWLDKMALYDNPVFLSLDHSKFDSTVNEDHLRCEHRFYNRVYKDNSLRKLLSRQLLNNGYSRNGIKYRVKGTRMSGDYNTGLGNCFLNRVVLESFLKDVKHSIMLDGDDSVVIIEKDALKKLDFQHFERMGFITKYEVLFDKRKVVYCQKQLVMSKPPTLCRQFQRALSHMSICLKHYTGKGYQHWFNGVLECEAYTNKNMPIFDKLLALRSGRRVIRDDEWYRKMANDSTTLGTYTDYKEFSKTFDISVHTVKLFEEALMNTFYYRIDYGGKSDSPSTTKLIVAQLGQRYNACPTTPDTWWAGNGSL